VNKYLWFTEQFPIGVIVYSPAQTLLLHNPAAERILGLDARHLRGESTPPAGWSLTGTDGRPLELHALAGQRPVGRGRQAQHSLMVGIAQANEPMRHALVHVTPLKGATGAKIGNLLALSPLREETLQPADDDAEAQVVEAGEPDPGRGNMPSLADIAKAAGYALGTVSMALRNHHKIAPTTRAKIHAVAEQLGYRPDPRLSQLMHALSRRRTPAFRSIIQAFSTLPKGQENRYVRDVIDGAAAKAAELGYGFRTDMLPLPGPASARMQRQLKAQGVEGLMLLPFHTGRSCHGLLDWDRFSVISTNGGIGEPEFDQVTPHWYSSMRLILTQLRAHGYRRVGVLVHTEIDTLVGNKLRAALATFPQSPAEPFEVHEYAFSGSLVVTAGSKPEAPFKHSQEIGVADKAGIVEWFSAVKPEALLITGYLFVERIVELLRLDVPGPVGIAVMDAPEDTRYAGTVEPARLVGARAIELLHTKLQTGGGRRESVQDTTLVRGQWRDGISLPVRASALLAQAREVTR